MEASLPPPNPETNPQLTRPGNANGITSELALAWPRSAQWTVALLLAAVLLLLGRFLLGGMGNARPAELVALGMLDLNQASRVQLMQLPGVGPALADRIVNYRQRHGPFKSQDELSRVPGIGPKTLDRLRPFLCAAYHETALEAPESGDSEIRHNAGTALSSKAAKLAGQIFDLNRAGLSDLQKLPGIGPKLSQRIVEERGRRPFASVDDLRRVAGIGPKTLAKLRPHVTVNADAGLAGTGSQLSPE